MFKKALLATIVLTAVLIAPSAEARGNNNSHNNRNQNYSRQNHYNQNNRAPVRQQQKTIVYKTASCNHHSHNNYNNGHNHSNNNSTEIALISLGLVGAGLLFAAAN